MEKTTITYPLFMKFRTGEFLKVISENRALIVSCGKNETRVRLTRNCMAIAEFLNKPGAIKIIRQDFEQVYGEAFYLYQKANATI